jgi:hypothetical protein
VHRAGVAAVFPLGHREEAPRAAVGQGAVEQLLLGRAAERVHGESGERGSGVGAEDPGVAVPGEFEVCDGARDAAFGEQAQVDGQPLLAEVLGGACRAQHAEGRGLEVAGHVEGVCVDGECTGPELGRELPAGVTYRRDRAGCVELCHGCASFMLAHPWVSSSSR